MRTLFVVKDSVIGNLTTEVTRIEIKAVAHNPAGTHWEIRLFDLEDRYCGGGSTNTPLRWLAKNLKEIG